MTTTDDTRAGLAALTARGHQPRRKLGPEHRTRTLYYDAGMGRIAWRRDGDDMWFHCDDDDAANAVRCALLDRVAEAGASISVYTDGRVVLLNRVGGTQPSLLAAYESLYPLPATVGEVAVEPETKGGTMATTLKEQYEAMVARGHYPAVARSKAGDFVARGVIGMDGRVPPAVVAACLQAGQLAAMEKAGISYFYNAGRQYPYQIKMPGTDKWKVYGSWFTAYLTAFPPSAPPDPAAELADDQTSRLISAHRDWLMQYAEGLRQQLGDALRKLQEIENAIKA